LKTTSTAVQKRTVVAQISFDTSALGQPNNFS
jgi:hypothetical protein